MNGRRVVGRRQDVVTELVQARPQETDVGGDVVQDIRDIRLVKVPGTVPLDARVRSLLEPALEVVDRGLTRPGHERVVLITG